MPPQANSNPQPEAAGTGPVLLEAQLNEQGRDLTARLYQDGIQIVESNGAPSFYPFRMLSNFTLTKKLLGGYVITSELDGEPLAWKFKSPNGPDWQQQLTKLGVLR